MKGVVVKPALCCGNTNFIGKFVILDCYLSPQETECRWCKKVQKDHDLVKVNGITIMNSSRIKWFNDDLDKEIQEEDVEEQIKEKENI